MAKPKEVHWVETKPPRTSRRWSTSGGRPPPSPYPVPHTQPRGLKSVLSIDGGGIRGYSSLVILQALMEKVGEIERAYDPLAKSSSIHSSALGHPNDEPCAAPVPKTVPISASSPCHYFDYIAGVGTGGIIALMLGRYRMSVAEAMERFRNICATVVEERQLTSPPSKPPRQRPVLCTDDKKSKHSTARTVELTPAWPSPNECDGDGKCRTIVCGCGSNLQPFRSYPSSDPQRHSVNDIISNCLRTNPAPGAYIDAKHFYNNPSRTVLTEVFSQLDPKNCETNTIDLLSIGSAITKPVTPRADELQYRTSHQIQLVHDELSSQPHKFNLNRYCRLDALEHCFRDIGVNEWEFEFSSHATFHRIEEETRTYLLDETVADEIQTFATALVEKRRLRAEKLRPRRRLATEGGRVDIDKRDGGNGCLVGSRGRTW